jgi:hypothetical protein
VLGATLQLPAHLDSQGRSNSPLQRLQSDPQTTQEALAVAVGAVVIQVAQKSQHGLPELREAVDGYAYGKG